MKQNLTNALVKNIVKGVHNHRFMYAIGGILENIVLYTYDGFVMYKAEVNSDFTDYLKQVKQPSSDFGSLTKIFTGMNKYIRATFAYADMELIKHDGRDLLRYTLDGYNYYFDPRFLTKFKNGKKYELNLWIFGGQHGLIVNEYDEHDDVFYQVALIMGVREK